MYIYMLLAQAPNAGGGGGGPTGGGPDMLFLMMLVFLPLFYFMVMRPAQRQEKDRKATLAGLKKNDEVVTNGGIVGTVLQIREKAVAGEDVIVVRIDDKIKIPVLRSGIYRVVTKSEAPSTDEATDAAKETSGK
jgi:preprotein translocase subunit YajC